MTDSADAMGAAAGAAIEVALVQLSPGEDAAANRAAIERLVRDATRRGAQLVVLPEYAAWFRPALDAAWLDAAEPLDGPFATMLTRLADETGTTIVAGMSERLERGDRFGNTLVAVAPGAGVVATYRKLHLYDAFGQRESDLIEPGAIGEPVVLDVLGLRVGLQTCYDLRFPEVTRRLVDAGAELVLVPSEWVRGPLKEHHWRTLAIARAIESTVYVAAPGHAPPIGVGSSLLVDPMGVVVAGLGEEPEGVAMGRVDAARVAAVRERNPSLALRRFRVVPIDDAGGAAPPSGR